MQVEQCLFYGAEVPYSFYQREYDCQDFFGGEPQELDMRRTANGFGWLRDTRAERAFLGKLLVRGEEVEESEILAGEQVLLELPQLSLEEEQQVVTWIHFTLGKPLEGKLLLFCLSSF